MDISKSVGLDDVSSSSFVGAWDLYDSSMHTVLTLNESGDYRHSLCGAEREHWGRWSLERQDGRLFLALFLQDASPRLAQSPNGWEVLPWPNVEAWAVCDVHTQQINLANALMIRQAAKSVPAPVFRPTGGFGPLQTNQPSPSGQMTPLPSQGLPVMRQWREAHDSWNALRREKTIDQPEGDQADGDQADGNQARAGSADVRQDRRQSEMTSVEDAAALSNTVELSHTIHDDVAALIRMLK